MSSALAAPAIEEVDDDATTSVAALDADVTEEPAHDDATAPAEGRPLANDDQRRDALRIAISNFADANAKVAKAKAGVARAATYVEQAEEAVAAAEAAVETAREQHAQAVAAAADDDTTELTSAVHAARDEHEAAVAALGRRQREHDAAIDALGRLGDNNDAAIAVEHAWIDLVVARNDVPRPIVEALIERIAEARREIFLARQIVGALLAPEPQQIAAGVHDMRVQLRANEEFNSISDLHVALERAQSSDLVRGGPLVEACARWRRALLSNPDAPPPPELAE